MTLLHEEEFNQSIMEPPTLFLTLVEYSLTSLRSGVSLKYGNPMTYV